jgi:hypothetical protein
MRHRSVVDSREMDNAKLKAFSAVHGHQSNGIERLRSARELPQVAVVEKAYQATNAIERAPYWYAGAHGLRPQEIHQHPNGYSATSIR